MSTLGHTVNDFDYLTPGHFLIGEATLTADNRMSRLQLLQQHVCKTFGMPTSTMTEVVKRCTESH